MDTAIAVGEAVSEGTYCQNAELEPSVPHTRYGNDCLFWVFWHLGIYVLASDKNESVLQKMQRYNRVGLASLHVNVNINTNEADKVYLTTWYMHLLCVYI